MLLYTTKLCIVNTLDGEISYQFLQLCHRMIYLAACIPLHLLLFLYSKYLYKLGELHVPSNDAMIQQIMVSFTKFCVSRLKILIELHVSPINLFSNNYFIHYSFVTVK